MNTVDGEILGKEVEERSGFRRTQQGRIHIPQWLNVAEQAVSLPLIDVPGGQPPLAPKKPIRQEPSSRTIRRPRKSWD